MSWEPNPLNPEAGHVPVPADPALISAGDRAGEISYRLFPHYALRYGDRGRAFTRSDSAWLATLLDVDDTAMERQVWWLRSVLANRGMPTPLLATHLRIMERTISRVRPDRAADARRLAETGAALQQQVDEVRDPGAVTARAEAFSADLAADLGQDVAVEVGLGHARRLAVGAAKLVQWAAIDQTLGLGRAVSSLLSWLEGVDSRRGDPQVRIALGDQALLLQRPALATAWPAALHRLTDEITAVATSGDGQG